MPSSRYVYVDAKDHAAAVGVSAMMMPNRRRTSQRIRRRTFENNLPNNNSNNSKNDSEDHDDDAIEDRVILDVRLGVNA